jgi:hypothetical protein
MLPSLLTLSNNAQSKYRDDDPGSGSSQGREETWKADRDHDEHERGCADPLVLLAYKERDPAERWLWDTMPRETGIVLERAGRQAGAGGLPVEIWLGKRKSLRRGR